MLGLHLQKCLCRSGFGDIYGGLATAHDLHVRGRVRGNGMASVKISVRVRVRVRVIMRVQMRVIMMVVADS